MAYNSSHYSGSDYGYGEYNLNSYAVNYDYAQIPTFMAYNGYEYNKPYYGYDPTPSLYFSPNYPANSSFQAISYSATTLTDPKSFEYDPNYGMTQLVISYSTLEFNEPAFDEYDPTPYGGGYDIAETYGKPLPPSDEICYPPTRSTSISPPSDAVPVGPVVPLPAVEEPIDEKAIKPQKETEGQVTVEKPQSQDSSKDQPREEVEEKSYETHDVEPSEGEDSEESEHDDEYYSGSGYGNGNSGGQCDEYNEKQVPRQYPSGLGLESMDLCESLFGYWPCLSRMKREHCCEGVADRGNYCQQESMWKGTADYLFGNPNPYGGGSGEDGSGYYGHGGEFVYGYERHYPTQAQYRQIEYTDGSW